MTLLGATARAGPALATYVRFHPHSMPAGSVLYWTPIYSGGLRGASGSAPASCRPWRPRCRRYYVATVTTRTGTRRTPAGFFVLFGGERVIEISVNLKNIFLGISLLQVWLHRSFRIPDLEG